MNTYLKQANDFLAKTNTVLTIEFLKHGKHFETDTESRDIYKCTLKRGKRAYKFNFGQSLNGTRKKEKPNAYDILACLQKYDVVSFEDFCGEFGYDEDSRKAEKIYKAVLDEYKNLCALFSDEELEEMAEIQ